MADRSVKVVLSADVARYRAAMNSAAVDTDKLNKSTFSLSKQIKQTFVSGAVFAGIAAVGAALKGTITLGVSFDQQMNTLGAVTHGTAAEMADAQKEAIALGNAIDIPRTSAADAADAMVELAKGGLTAKQAMDAARGTLMLAAAAQVDGAQAAEIQAQALNEFQLSATQAGHVADVIANTANAASGELTDIATALTYTGGVAHQFGISIDDTATMLGIFAKNGLIGSLAGTTLRSMLVHLAAPSNQATKAMQTLGLTVYDAQGQFVGLRSLSAQLAKAQERLSPAAFQAATSVLFGQRAVQGAAFAAQAGASGFDAFAKSATTAGGATDLANAKMKGLPGSLQKAENAAQNFALTTYEKMEPALESMVDGFTSAVDTVGPIVGDVFAAGVTTVSALGKAFSVLPGPVKEFAIALAAIGLANKIGLFDKFAGVLARVKQSVAFASYQVDLGASRFAKYGVIAKSAGSSVLEAFGGPWGIAIAGAAAGVGFLIAQIKAAGPVMTDFTGVIDDNTGALAKNAQAAAAKHLSDSGAFDIIKKVGIDTKVYTQAILGNAAAQREVNKALAAQPTGNGGEQAMQRYDLAKATRQYNSDLKELADTQTKVNDVLHASGDAIGDTTSAATDAFLAYDDARKSLNGYGLAAADTSTKLSALMQATIASTEAMLQQALSLRQAIASSLTGFVSPTGAWDDTVQQMQSATKTSSTAASTAADAAVKEGRKRADSTKASAKAEHDAAVKSADGIRDAIVARAKADEQAAKDAQTNAQTRVTAAKNEVSELQKLYDQQSQDAKDAQTARDKTAFDLQSAQLNAQRARAGLANAKTPAQRANWQSAYNNALKDESAAQQAATKAADDYNSKSAKAAGSKSKLSQATKDEKAAEGELAQAKTDAAAATESATKRQKAADDAYTKAKEQADTRYQKSVDAAEAALQKLIDKQDAVRQSAQDMSSGATSALSDMSKNAQPSLKQYLDTLKGQVQAQQDWHDNIVKLAQNLPPDVAIQLAQLGPKSAPLVAELVNGTHAQLQQFADLFPKSTDQGVQGLVDSIVRAAIPAGENAAYLSDSMIQKFLTEFSNAKTQEQAKQALAALQAAMQQQADQHPIVISATVDLAAQNQQMANAAGPGYNPATFWGQAPKYADGGDVADGWFWTGERGPELGYKQGNNVHMFDAASSAKMNGPTIIINDNSTTINPQTEPASVARNQRLATAAAIATMG